MKRGKCCHDLILEMGLPDIAESEAQKFKIFDNDVRVRARKAGRTHEIATAPAQRSRPRDEPEPTRHRRLRRKSAPEALIVS